MRMTLAYSNTFDCWTFKYNLQQPIAACNIICPHTTHYCITRKHISILQQLTTTADTNQHHNLNDNSTTMWMTTCKHISILQKLTATADINYANDNSKLLQLKITTAQNSNAHTLPPKTLHTAIIILQQKDEYTHIQQHNPTCKIMYPHATHHWHRHYLTTTYSSTVQLTAAINVMQHLTSTVRGDLNWKISIFEKGPYSFAIPM